MKKTFVISDTHFSHANIIKYCKRPFYNINEMNYAMEEIWNELVSPEDIVFHLGDFSLAGPDKVGHILERLKGNKILVAGNHDRGTIKTHPAWAKVCDNFNFTYQGVNVHMQHHPWEKMNPNDLYLHGHCHGNMGKWNSGQVDMGVDCWDFAPVELEEVIEFWRENKCL